MGLRQWIVTGGAVGFSAIALLWLSGAIGAQPLQAGNPAPDFALKDQDGRVRRLSDYRGVPVVLAFYPADMTAGCTLEAHSMRDHMQDFVCSGVQVFGISVQDVASKRAFCDKEGLNYPVLADIGGTVADEYGVKLPIGLAKRVTFVVDGKGEIAHVIDKVDVRDHAAQVLHAVGAHQEQAGRKKAVVGRRVSDAYLPNVADGKMVSLYGDATQKATVAIFVASQCPVSRAYEGRMAGLAAELGPAVRVIGISANKDETAAQAAAHFSRAHTPFPIVKDEHNRLADRLGAEVTPEAFVMDSAGVLRYHGRIDDSQDASGVHEHDLRDAIRAVLAGKAPAHQERLAIGCSILREQT